MMTHPSSPGSWSMLKHGRVVLLLKTIHVTAGTEVVVFIGMVWTSTVSESGSSRRRWRDVTR